MQKEIELKQLCSYEEVSALLPDRMIVYALIWQRKRPVRAGVQQALHFDG